MREGWKETTLGEVASVERGVSWSKEQESWQPVQGAVPVVRIGNVQLSGIAMSETLYVRNVKKTSIDMKAILTSTILMVGSNGNPDRVGNVHLAGTNLSGHLYASFLIGIDCGASSLPEFLWMYLQSQAVQARISEATAGSTGLKNIRLAWLRSMVVQIPPLAEQKRIVDVIGAVDAYVASLESYANAARTARAALLHELLTTNTQGWKQTTLGEVMTVEGSRIDPSTISDTTPYIGLEHLETDAARIGKHGAPSQVSSAVAPFVNGDVLFGRLRPYLRKVALATEAGVASPELLVLRPTEECLPSFLLYLCSRPATIEACVAMSAGSRMPRTSATDLASIQIPLPPLAEQQRIVDVIGSVDGAIAGADRAAEDARSLRSGLLSDLLSGDHAIPESYDRLLGAA